MHRPSLEHVTLEKFQKLLPFDVDFFEAISQDDILLHQFIRGMPNATLPYAMLLTIYGGEINELILSEQLERLRNLNMIMTAIGKVHIYYTAVTPEPWELKEE
jgi:hypothetical protein